MSVWWIVLGPVVVCVGVVGILDWALYSDPLKADKEAARRGGEAEL